MFKKIRHIHFVGIGGSGMSGIAEVLLTLGYEVSGSDLKKSATTVRLQERGAVIRAGHRASHVEGAHVVVTSTAVSRENSEVVEAIRRKIPVIPRIEMLAELARLKYTIAVAGTHGKTTTTSLISLVLQAGRLDPTVVVGGRMHNIGTGARVGRGEYLVAEADESDGSFLKLTPTLGIITNIDNDHLDYWGTMRALFQGFDQFANKVPFYGTLFLGIDDAGSRKLLPSIRRRVVTYGFAPDADIKAVDVEVGEAGTQFSVSRSGKILGRVGWKIPGRHNVMNALAAVAVGLELEMDFPAIAKALASYKGVGRRLEWKGEARGVTVIDDYAHHPSEIRSTLQALRERWPRRRIAVIFQPHRFSRTRQLAGQFGPSFKSADKVFLLDIYPAGEKPIKGITSQWLANRVGRSVNVSRLKRADASAVLGKWAKPGDVVLTFGAGDVWKLGEDLLRALSRNGGGR